MLIIHHGVALDSGAATLCLALVAPQQRLPHHGNAGQVVLKVDITLAAVLRLVRLACKFLHVPCPPGRLLECRAVVAP
jgi:hypothetical protein